MKRIILFLGILFSLFVALPVAGQLSCSIQILSDSVGCSPLVLIANANDSSTSPVILRSWTLSTCDDSTVFNTGIGTANTFSYILTNNSPTTQCYKLTLLEENQNFDTAISTFSNILVYPFPKIRPVFSVQSISCDSAIVTFYPNAIGGSTSVDSISVDFGCINMPLQFYADSLKTIFTLVSCVSGYFNPHIVWRNALGCFGDTIASDAFWFGPPKAKGTLSPTSLSCPAPPQIINFTDSSFGNITSWLWNFGDGTSSSQQNPIHIYPISGCYVVILTVCDGMCCDSAVIDTFCINGPGITSFSETPTSLCTCKDTVHYVIGTFGATNCLLIAGCNGGVANLNIDTIGTNANPSYIHFDILYCYRDSCQPQLFLSNNTGCQIYLNLPFLYIDSPIVHFTYASNNFCDSGAICFFDNTTYYFPKDTTTKWHWDFGDGVFDTVRNPCHTYLNLGNHLVTLSVTSSFGCSSSASQTIGSFPNLLPVIVDTITNLCNVATVCFNASLNDQGLSFSSWHWNFGDGTLDSTAYPCHPFSSNGLQTITFNGVDNIGCTRGDTSQVTIAGIDHLAAEISVSQIIDSCQFKRICFVDSDATGGSIQTFSWLIDANTFSGNPVCTNFISPGSHLVTLNVTDSNGCTAIADTSINIVLTLLNAQIGYSQSGDSVQFTNLSTGDFSAVSWSLGDGVVSNIGNPLHIYNANGTYSITLSIADSMGCTSDTAITVQVFVSSLQILKETYNASVEPNPFSNQVLFKINGGNGNEFELQVLDMMGRILKNEHISRYYLMNGTGLVTGLYTYVIFQKGQPIITGKIAAQ